MLQLQRRDCTRNVATREERITSTSVEMLHMRLYPLFHKSCTTRTEDVGGGRLASMGSQLLMATIPSFGEADLR